MAAVRAAAPTHSTATSALDAARSLAGPIAAAANDGEEARQVVDSVHAALGDSGLLHLFVPGELGGSNLELDALLAVVEEVSRADASTGWSYLAHAVVTGLFAGYLPDEACTLFCGDGRTVAAGMLAPRAWVRKADAGLQVGGRYSFASGSAHARWIAAAGLLASDTGGPPSARAFLLPRNKIAFHDNWHVLGLRATGSVDYVVPDRHVPWEYTFDLMSRAPARGPASLRLGTIAVSAAGHMAVAIGTARRALEELVQIVDDGKVRPPMPPLREQPLYLGSFSTIEAKLQSVRALAGEVVGEAVEAARNRDEPLDVHEYRIRQATTTVVHICESIVLTAFEWSGSNGLRDGHPLQRCLRDMLAQRQHVLVDAHSLVDAAATAMDRVRTWSLP